MHNMERELDTHKIANQGAVLYREREPLNARLFACTRTKADGEVKIQAADTDRSSTHKLT